MRRNPKVIKDGNRKLVEDTVMKDYFYDPQRDQRPHTINNEKCSYGFRFDPAHQKGSFLQFVVKETIHKTYKSMLKKVKDHEISKSDVKEFRDIMDELIEKRIRHRHPTKPHDPEKYPGMVKAEEYKQEFHRDIADILCYYMDTNENLTGKVKGKFTKKMLKWLYSKVPKKYHKNAFVFEDERLSKIREAAYVHIERDWPENEQGFLKQIINIILFIAKEDIWYRVRWMLMLQDMNKDINKINTNNRYIDILRKISDESLNFELETLEIELQKPWGGLEDYDEVEKVAGQLPEY